MTIWPKTATTSSANFRRSHPGVGLALYQGAHLGRPGRIDTRAVDAEHILIGGAAVPA